MVTINSTAAQPQMLNLAAVLSPILLQGFITLLQISSKFVKDTKTRQEF